MISTIDFKKRNLILTRKNNFDLSSLRALEALKFLVQSGVPQTQLSAQGSADNQVSARTLTIMIRDKGKNP